MKRALQKFSKEYLDQCKEMKPEEIVRFVEDFRILYGQSKPSKSKLISIKIPEDLLEAFRTKANLSGVPYQTQIKNLMAQWLGLGHK
jgi:uncharacterized protein (DUF4415 family)